MQKGNKKHRGRNPKRVVRPVKTPLRMPAEAPIPVEIPQRVGVAQ